MLVGVYERSTGRLVFSTDIKFRQTVATAADWQYFDEAWRRAVTAGAARIEELDRHEVRFVMPREDGP